MIPLNCIFESTFYDLLYFTTLAPIGWVVFISLVYFLGRHRILRRDGEIDGGNVSRLKGRCVYAVVIFLCTVFPIVSTTIFETYRYDRRLGNGSAFLIADYSVSETDDLHRHYVMYASFMAILYCLGTPVVCWVALRSNKKLIQRLQNIDEMIDHFESNALDGTVDLGLLKMGRLASAKEAAGENGVVHRIFESTSQRKKSVAWNALVLEASVDKQRVSADSLKAMKSAIFEDHPILAGLSPLYKDYKSEHWWFQIPNFVMTLCLCGLVTLLGDSHGASQVFLALGISIVYLLLLANCHPYLNKSDNLLAQICQMSITFALAVSVLEQTETSSQDTIFGPLLIICTVFNLVMGVVLLTTDFLKEAFPDQFEKAYGVVSRLWLLLSRLWSPFSQLFSRFIRWSTPPSDLVAPAVDAASNGMPPLEGITDLNTDDQIQGDIQSVAVQSFQCPIAGKIYPVSCGGNR